MIVDSDNVLAMFCIDCAFVDDEDVCKSCDYKRRIESAQELHQQWSRDSPESHDKSIVRKI